MKTPRLTVLLVLAASPLSLLAASATDVKIGDAARASDNDRAVPGNRVTAKAHDGGVTLTGTVQDREDKHPAADPAGHLPGVTDAGNEIVVAPVYPESPDAWIAGKIRGRRLVKAGGSATCTTVAATAGSPGAGLLVRLPSPNPHPSV